MTYCTREDLITRFGEHELINIENQNGPRVTEAAIIDASGEIDLYISSVFNILLLGRPTSDLLTGWCCDIARYRLWANANNQNVQEAVIIRYKNITGLLEKVAKGSLRIPIRYKKGDKYIDILIPEYPNGFASGTCAHRVFNLMDEIWTGRSDTECDLFLRG